MTVAMQLIIFIPGVSEIDEKTIVQAFFLELIVSLGQ